jgi:hypothetical protein
MRVTRRSEALGVLLISALALVLATAAGANDAPDSDEIQSRPTRVNLSSLKRPTSKRRWIPAHLHLEGKAGLEYRRSLTVRDRDFVWAIQGPMVASGTYGLGFELRF